MTPDDIANLRELMQVLSISKDFQKLVYVDPVCVARALAALDAAEVEGWQPIETAPRDSKPVLLFAGHWRGVGNYEEARYDGDPVWVDERAEFIEPCPTHWRPLPAPPAAAKEERP